MMKIFSANFCANRTKNGGRRLPVIKHECYAKLSVITYLNGLIDLIVCRQLLSLLSFQYCHPTTQTVNHSIEKQPKGDHSPHLWNPPVQAIHHSQQSYFAVQAEMVAVETFIDVLFQLRTWNNKLFPFRSIFAVEKCRYFYSNMASNREKLPLFPY